MIQLPNGCYCSDLAVNPTTWKQASAPIQKDWFIWYRFYDPRVTVNGKIKPKLVPVKGMNQFKKITERRQATEELLKQELEDLQKGYNPIKGKFDVIAPVASHEEMGLVPALEWARDNIKVEHSTWLDIKSVIKYVCSAAVELQLTDFPISKVSKKHIRLILDELGRTKEIWTDNNFNHYRKYLSIIFSFLEEYEMVTHDPAAMVTKRATVLKKRLTLTYDERILVHKHLFAKYYNFWRFAQIFFHSGARIREMLRVKYIDVDQEKRSFKRLIKKGKSRREVWTPIKDVAWPFWAEILSVASGEPGQYLFAESLVPGSRAIRSDQISRRWHDHVKMKLGIKADFYALKHLNTTEMRKFLSAEDVATLNGHTSTAMVVNIYDTQAKERENEKIRKANNSFV